MPGDILVAQWSAERPATIQDTNLKSWEASVLWTTTGKGATDIGVHFFERKKSVSPDAMGTPHRLSTVLPASPLSYEGRIFSVRWSVRVRLFFENGQAFTEDCPFEMGDTCQVESWAAELSTEAEEIGDEA